MSQMTTEEKIFRLLEESMSQMTPEEKIDPILKGAVLSLHREEQRISSEDAVKELVLPPMEQQEILELEEELEEEKKDHEETKSKLKTAEIKLSGNNFVIENLNSHIHYLNAQVQHIDEQMKLMSKDHKEVVDDLRGKLQKKTPTLQELNLERVTKLLEVINVEQKDVDPHRKNGELQELLKKSEEERKMLENAFKKICGALRDANYLSSKQKEEIAKLKGQCKNETPILQKECPQRSEELSRREYLLQMEYTDLLNRTFLKEIDDNRKVIELESKLEKLKVEKKDLEEEKEKDAQEILTLKESLDQAQNSANQAKQALKILRAEEIYAKAIGAYLKNDSILVDKLRESLAKVEKEKEILEKRMNKAIAHAELSDGESAQLANMVMKYEKIVLRQEKRIKELEAENSKLKSDLTDHETDKTFSSKDQANLQATEKQEPLKNESKLNFIRLEKLETEKAKKAINLQLREMASWKTREPKISTGSVPRFGFSQIKRRDLEAEKQERQSKGFSLFLKWNREYVVEQVGNDETAIKKELCRRWDALSMDSQIKYYDLAVQKDQKDQKEAEKQRHAFSMFVKMNREYVVEQVENDEVKIQNELNRRWNNLTEGAHNKYYDLAKKLQKK